MKENIQEMLTLWEKNSSAAEAGAVAYQQIGNHIGFAVKDEKAFLQLNRDSLDSYRKNITLNERIRSIANDTTASVESRKKKIHQLINAAKKENVLSEKAVGQYRAGVKILKESGDQSGKLTDAMDEAASNAQQFASAAGNGKDRLKQAQPLG